MRIQRQFNWGAKLFLFLLVFAILPMVVLSYGVARDSQKRFLDFTLANLGGLAKTKAQVVDQFMTDRVMQVERISTLVTDLYQSALQDTSDTPLPPDGAAAPPEPVQGSPGAAAAGQNDKATEAAVKAGPAAGDNAHASEPVAPEPSIPATEELPEPGDTKINASPDAASFP